MTTTYIAWTDANKKLNVQPGLTGLPVTLNQSSSHGPALAFYNNSLYLAWTGTDGQLNVISSSDGTTWTNQVTLGQHSNTAPALIASSNSLSLVWTGTDGKLNVIFSSDGKSWINQVTLSQTSDLAPASAAGPFQVQVIALNGASGILSTLSGIAIGDGSANQLKPTSKQEPALTFYQGLLYLSWTDDTGNLNVMSSSDGENFQNQVSIGQPSSSGPALTASSSLLFLAWIDANGKLNMSSSVDGKEWAPPTTVNQVSSFAPALAVADF